MESRLAICLLSILGGTTELHPRFAGQSGRTKQKSEDSSDKKEKAGVLAKENWYGEK